MGALFTTQEDVNRLIDKQRDAVRRHKNKIGIQILHLDWEKKTSYLKLSQIAKTRKSDVLVEQLAKKIARIDTQIKKLGSVMGTLADVEMSLQNIKTTSDMALTLKGATREIKKLDSYLKIPVITNMLKDFTKTMDSLGMKHELLTETLDSTYESDIGEEEANTVKSILSGLDDSIAMETKEILGDGALSSTNSLTKRFKKLKQ